MAAFITAYIVVWLAVVLYVARLGTEQRRLRRTMEALQAEMRRDELARAA